MEKAENHLDRARNDLRPIRCTYCGRFLGYECVKVGMVRLKCKGCKMWTTILGEDWELTMEKQLVNIE